MLVDLGFPFPALLAMSRRYSFLMDFVPGFWWKNLAGLNVWICRVFIIFLLHPVWVIINFVIYVKIELLL